MSEVSDRLAEMRRTREERQTRLTSLQHEMTGAEQRLNPWSKSTSAGPTFQRLSRR